MSGNTVLKAMSNDAETLIKSLQNPDIYPHEVSAISLVETHISWVILTGPYAYKIKKPINLGFLDFSTLDKRKHYCEEEIRLNSRLAPDIYLDVVSISGSPDSPVLNGTGPAIEYAIRMNEFNPDNELDKLLARESLKPEHIRLLAEKVAAFHQDIAIAKNASPYGTPASILGPGIENLEQIQSLVTDHQIQQRLDTIRQWTSQTWAALKPVFEQRKAEGYVRECHGDLHLHNLALVKDDILIFDCIEFNPNLYWIDVISEIAFTVMDLDDRHQSTLAWEFLNRYLQLTGDYDGITVLRFYLVYRAMVRAKVDCIRAHQEDSQTSDRDQIMKEFQSYLTLAEQYIHHEKPVLIIMHGLSGSGKTSIAGDMTIQLGALHIRSDIERKRLSGMTETQRSGSSVSGGIYTSSTSEKTYNRLAGIAANTINAGYRVIVDAAFLSREKRQQFYDLSKQLDTPFYIIDCQAPESALRSRIAQRYKVGTDASEATLQVLEHQLQNEVALDEQEKLLSIQVDTSLALDTGQILARLFDDKASSL